MAQSWFYQHEGKTEGPVSVEELKKLADEGLLKAQDMLWSESHPQAAIPAEAALDFDNLTVPGRAPTASAASAPSLPDWLADVARSERKGPLPPLLPTTEAPDWLEDLRLWISLELLLPGAKTSPGLQTQGLPD